MTSARRPAPTEMHVLVRASNPNDDMGLKKMLADIPADDISAAVNAVNDGGFTPLHIACEYGSTACVKLLLKYRADTRAIAEDFSCPIHLACKEGHTTCVDALLGNDPMLCNLATDNGTTPLHDACVRGRGDCVAALLRGGAMSCAENAGGETPADLARAAGHMRCEAMVRAGSCAPCSWGGAPF